MFLRFVKSQSPFEYKKLEGLRGDLFVFLKGMGKGRILVEENGGFEG